YRSPSAPPSAVLRQLCQHLGLEVDEDVIRAGKEIHPEEVLTEVEFTFYDILRAERPLLPSVELAKLCLQRCMKRSTFWVYLMYSPILAQYAAGIYGLRGVQFAPGEADALRPRRGRSRIVVDYGWKRNGLPWIAYRVTEAIIRTGVVGVPAGIRDALGEG